MDKIIGHSKTFSSINSIKHFNSEAKQIRKARDNFLYPKKGSTYKEIWEKEFKITITSCPLKLLA